MKNIFNSIKKWYIVNYSMDYFHLYLKPFDNYKNTYCRFNKKEIIEHINFYNLSRFKYHIETYKSFNDPCPYCLKQFEDIVFL